MKKYANLIIVIMSFIILILIFLNKSLVSNTIILSLYIWFNTLVPSMFPMFVLSDILINYHFIDYIPKYIKMFIAKVFNISESGVLVLLLSLISGFPSNGINIKSAYDMHLLSKEECEHLLLFNHFANPLLVLQTIGVFYLNNSNYGIIILISHILSNIIIGILFRKRNYPTNTNYIANNKKSQSFGYVLSSSINKSINTLLMISGTVTLFLILSTLISNIFNLNVYLDVLAKGILEMTMGLSSLSSIPINDIYKVIFSTMFISFGGLSIHLQVMTSLGEDIRYKNYFKGRIYQTLISGIISYIVMLIIF